MKDAEKTTKIDSRIDQLRDLLLEAMRDRRVVEVRYGFSRPPTVTDLAAIERALNSGIRGMILAVMQVADPDATLPRRILRLDVASMQHHLDDGEENEVRVQVDFAKLLPSADEGVGA